MPRVVLSVPHSSIRCKHPTLGRKERTMKKVSRNFLHVHKWRRNAIDFIGKHRIFAKYFPFIVVGYFILLSATLLNIQHRDISIEGIIHLYTHNLLNTILLVISLLFGLTIRNTTKELTTMYQDSSSLNKLLMDKSPVAIVQVDTKGTIIYVNEAVSKVFTSSGILGKNILEMKSIQQTGIHDGFLKALNGTGYEIKNEFYVSRLTNNKRFLDIYIYPTYSYEKKEEVNGAVAFFYDISEEVNLRHKMEYNYLSTIEALANLVDARDAYTGEHSKNVSKYTMMLCNELEIVDKQELRKIKLAADFHDIGKIGISDLILNKPDRLTDDEFAKMKKHPSLGADIIRKIDGFNEVSEIIRYHHERWDGKGYPSNLTGYQIPYGSQIIAVADTYDAITSDRVYRKGRPKEVALKIIFEEKGTQFNAEIAEKFVSMMSRYSEEE